MLLFTVIKLLLKDLFLLLMFIFFLSWVGGCLLFVNVADFNLASAFSLFALLQIGAPRLEGRSVQLQLRVRANRKQQAWRHSEDRQPLSSNSAASSLQHAEERHLTSTLANKDSSVVDQDQNQDWDQNRDQQIVLRSTWGSLTGTPFYNLNKVFANWSSSRECPYRTGSPDAFRELII